jgi:hypothetical protein
MKKIILTIVMVVTLTIAFASVEWGNGAPIYEVNFVENCLSAMTTNSNVFFAWSVYNERTSKIKIQKYDANGNPIWENPIVIFETEGNAPIEKMICDNNDECYIILTLNNYPSLSSTKLFKINGEGDVLWDREISQNNHWSNEQYLITSNNGIIITRLEANEIRADLFQDDGTQIWSNKQLYNFGDVNYPTFYTTLINENFFFAISCGDNVALGKFNIDGELMAEQSVTGAKFTAGKTINNEIYLFYDDIYNDNVDLVLWKFDDELNSLTGSTPISITNNTAYQNYIAGNNYFYCVSTTSNDSLKILKCNLSGEILGSEIIDVAHDSHIFVHDAEQDFIIVRNLSSCNILKLDENSVCDSYVLPSNFNLTYPYPYNVNYVNDKYVIFGIFTQNEKHLSVLSTTGNDATINNISNIYDEVIWPKMIYDEGELSAFWYSPIKKSIMKQKFTDEGTPYYPINGIPIIEDNSKLLAIDNKLVTYKLTHFDEENDQITLNTYNLDGDQINTENMQFQIPKIGYCAVKVSKFYQGYLFLINSIDKEFYIYFNENGLIWNQVNEIDSDDINYPLEVIAKGSNIFYHQDNQPPTAIKVNEDGTIAETVQLGSDCQYLRIYGNDDDFFVKVYLGSDTSNIYYFHNNELFWDEPWQNPYSIADIKDAIFVDGGFYLISDDYGTTVNVDKYDLNHELQENQSFSFQTNNSSESWHLIPYFNENNFIFTTFDIINDNDMMLNLKSFLLNGELNVPDISEDIINYPHLMYLQQKLIDNSLFCFIYSDYKIQDGDLLRNIYAQKIDLSDFVGNSENNNPQVNDKYQLSSYPNPFSSSSLGKGVGSKIDFSLPKAGKVNLAIYNIKGQKVKTLTNEKYSKGKHLLLWNGKNDSNKEISSGVYFYKLDVDGKTKNVEKCLLIK